ncbi:MAG TPA: efflux transporter outer membrane subunit [Stellaceae bacterium]|nr:efflux transporter outer membrane subunit [Stellaceae bacterium]
MTAGRTCLAVVGVLLCAGCDLGPDYRRPPLDVPAGWQQAAGGAVWPAADWWRGFGSAELDQLMVEAQQANYDLAAAVARVREADAQVRIAGAALLPTASLTAGVTSEQLGGSGRGVNGTFYQVAPIASYEVDFWGKNRASLESAKASALASRYDQQVVALTVETSVANTYFTILSLQDRIRVAQQNLANAQDALNGIVAQQNLGTATKLDVVQQQTVVATERAAIPPLEQQFQQNINALAILLGKPPEQVKITGGSLAALAIRAVAPGLPSELLARRPDVAEAEADLVAANANIKVARAQFFPDVTLTGEGGFESAALAGLFTPAAGIYSLAAAATQPIFTGGSLEGQLELSKARYDELLQDYRKAVISAFGDVENALIARQKTEDQTVDQQDTVQKARQAYQISERQYRAGTVTLLTVLTTENALFPAEDTLVQDKLANLEATVSLFQALGGGWTETTATQAAQTPR